MQFEEIKNIINNIVYSYEVRLRSIESILETTSHFFEGFQDSFLNAKQEVEEVKVRVRERLAKDASLRRKDFDNLMQGILLIQCKGEGRIKNLLDSCLREQKEMACVLSENLNQLIVALGKGEIKKVKESQLLIKSILAKQDKSKNEAIIKLKEFEKGQREITKRLQELLVKRDVLHIEDLKQVFRDFHVTAGKEEIFT